MIIEKRGNKKKFFFEFQIAIFGILTNGSTLFIIGSYRNFWNPFGILCGGFAASHCISLSILTLWMTFVIAM